MSWEIGFDDEHQRDIGYGVPAYCDHPGCEAEIDRGVASQCGFNSDEGCGLHFCAEHLCLHYANPEDDPDEPCRGELCDACAYFEPTYPAKPDHPKWLQWKLSDESWEDWRILNPAAVAAIKEVLKKE